MRFFYNTGKLALDSADNLADLANSTTSDVSVSVSGGSCVVFPGDGREIELDLEFFSNRSICSRFADMIKAMQGLKDLSKLTLTYCGQGSDNLRLLARALFQFKCLSEIYLSQDCGIKIEEGVYRDFLGEIAAINKARVQEGKMRLLQVYCDSNLVNVERELEVYPSRVIV